MRILVALSGGVDSSVVAHLLHEQGHELVGLMMKIWTDPLAPEVRRALPKKCCSIEHIQRARSVCKKLDIPFYVVNFEEEFKNRIVEPMIEGYKEGKTPNPCIECNRSIKFGVLLGKAKELGCEALATGHYAQIEEGEDGNEHILKRAKDVTKDQSYFLYTLTQEKLGKIIFPLGGMLKEDVFKLAQKYDIGIPDWYQESQDLCFYPEKSIQPFLKRYIKESPGPILSKDGTKIGEHSGLPFYTIGQRKGLKMGGLSIPLHVVEKDSENNALIAAEKEHLDAGYVDIDDMKWVNAPKINEKLEITARIHSLGKFEKGTLLVDETQKRFRFTKPVQGIAPGQSAVFYDGDQVVGGGVIV